jgi:hypothetical protein
MFPARYELGFYAQKMAFFLVTAVKTSNLTHIHVSKGIPTHNPSD